MNTYRKTSGSIFLAMAVLALALGGYVNAQAADLQIAPDQAAITPALLKAPIVFKGSGFTPKEIIVVEMVIPKGVQVKGVQEGENVGLANGNADEAGKFETKMGAMATLNTLFQVGWTPLIKPDFSKASPLPPGQYEILATGVESDSVGKAMLTILPPPPPEKK
ncbi:MAG: hypothetical protein KKB20_12905 [Proteobacteria bacterium]|nr:hypothetical protein [Pseudomonadota bacterium]